MSALPYSSRLTGGRCRGPLPIRFKGGDGGGGGGDGCATV